MSHMRTHYLCQLCFVLTIQMVGLLAGTSQAQQGWTDGGYGTVPTTSSADWDRRWNGGGWLGNSGVRTGWQLGITGDNTDVGVMVRQVSPNSAAARVGISPGDIIVCVDGDQVGRVGSQIYDLTEELRHHADSSGRVQMLVQQRRTAQLRAMQVQLDDQNGGLSGTLMMPSGRLPFDSIVTVQLENVTRPHFVVGDGQISFRVTTANQGRIPFQLNFDPRYISNQDRYQVRAFVTSGGRTIYDTPQPQFVLTQGAPNTVQMILEPTSITQYPGIGGSGGNVIAAGYNPAEVYGRQITTVYQRYLGRSPTSIELAAWYQIPDVDYRLTRLPSELMASQEFFDRTGNNRAAWLQRVFSEIIGRTPSPVEMNEWMRRFAELRYSRMELLDQLNITAGR